MGRSYRSTKEFGPGFDFLRIGLACTIVMTHAALLSGRAWVVRDTPLWFVEYALVPMFFALSGFLIAGSALRLNLKNFLINRGLRIVPALGVDVIVCALIIGPLMTTLTWHRYVSDPEFARYFLNITGWIHYALPGVFEDNPTHRVNGALWTVPFEIACYAVMSALMMTRFIHNRGLVALVTLGYLVCGMAVMTAKQLGLLPDMGDRLLCFFFVERGAQLVAAFLMGILAYLYRDLIPYDRRLLLLALAICAVAVFMLDHDAIDTVGNRLVVLPALVYLTVWLGVTPIPIPRVFHTGDYSYGIYLYHDPLLQVLIAMLPVSVVMGSGGWVVLVVLGLTAVSLLAALSWHFIEKPVLGLRKKFSFVARVREVAGKDDVTIAPDVTADDMQPEVETIVKPVPHAA